MTPDDHAAEAPEDLLGLTLAAAVRDRQTVTPRGGLVRDLPDGVTIHRSQTIVDDRGVLFELFDPRWDWHPDPIITSYVMTVRPGRAKGWAVHKAHEDRYAILFGEIELVLYDVRPTSSTRGRVFRIVLSEYDRCQINIPAFVWHGNRNLGSRDAVLVNFPTVPFDHANPDKYRLPIDSPLIPYSFQGAPGW